MGTVYLAENVRLGTLWAIKRIEKSGKGKGLLTAEPEVLKKLNHPALPKIFDVLEDEKSLYIVSDFMEGVSLEEKLKEVRKFDEPAVVEWGIQICDVLDYLHSLKPNPIIYRDMKPANLILGRDGRIKLIDFGAAREYREERVNDTVYIGTRGYAAPEQYGCGQTNEATDIYSLGVTLYTLVTGRSPNEPPYEILPVRTLDTSLSRDLEAIITKCTRPDPSERYLSAAKLKEDLKKLSGKLNLHETAGEAFSSGAEVVPNRAVFNKRIITVWDNAEFSCELAYYLAKNTSNRILLADLDLLAPKVDLILDVPKFVQNPINHESTRDTGLSLLSDYASRGMLTVRAVMEASVKRRELKNLHIITGSYRLQDYEYFSNEYLIEMVDRFYAGFDITILSVNRSIYDSYTIIALDRSDINIIPLRADAVSFREFNSFILYLSQKQQIPVDKFKFVAFEYDRETDMDTASMKEVTDGNFAGTIRLSRRRVKCRCLKEPYPKRMEKEVIADYGKISEKLGITPKLSAAQKFKGIFATT
jgi:serine/threonine protein kinase